MREIRGLGSLGVVFYCLIGISEWFFLLSFLFSIGKKCSVFVGLGDIDGVADDRVVIGIFRMVVG